MQKARLKFANGGTTLDLLNTRPAITHVHAATMKKKSTYSSVSLLAKILIWVEKATFSELGVQSGRFQFPFSNRFHAAVFKHGGDTGQPMQWKAVTIIYIDGSCEFLIRRSINKLLAEHIL